MSSPPEPTPTLPPHRPGLPGRRLEGEPGRRHRQGRPLPLLARVFGLIGPRGEASEGRLARADEPPAASIAAEDLDILFGAVLRRLRGVASEHADARCLLDDDVDDDAEHLRRVALDCAAALEQLHWAVFRASATRAPPSTPSDASRERLPDAPPSSTCETGHSP